MHEAINLVSRIRAAFPLVSSAFDQKLQKWDLELSERNDLPWTELLERFSHLTTEAAHRGDAETALAYLQFMEDEANRGSSEMRSAIDTYYAEILVWGVKDQRAKKHIWDWFRQH